MKFLLSSENTFDIETNNNYFAEIAGLFNNNYFFAYLTFQFINSSIDNLIVKEIKIIRDDNSNKSEDLINFDTPDNYSNISINTIEQQIYEKILSMLTTGIITTHSITLKNEHFSQVVILINKQKSDIQLVKYVKKPKSESSSGSDNKQIVIPKTKKKSKTPVDSEILKLTSWSISLMFVSHIFKNKIYAKSKSKSNL